MGVGGSFPPSGSCPYLLTVVEYLTRWPGAIPLSGITEH